MQPYDTNSYKDSFSGDLEKLPEKNSLEPTYSSSEYSSRAEARASSSARAHSHAPKKKKPVTITLVSALVACLVAFLLGFFISSAAMVDSRVADVNEKNAELQAEITQKDEEISALKSEIESKNESNIALGEKIQEHLKTIDNFQRLQSDAPQSSDSSSSQSTVSPVDTLTGLSLSQQLILLVVLLVIVVFIISVTCGFIASKTGSEKRGKSKSRREKKPSETLHETTEDSFESSADASEDSSSSDSEKTDDSLSELGATKEFSFDNAVNEAIDLLYHNNLEDNISSVGGFKFGITNFEEILSDKAKSKSFGNTENGDFVAFMSTKSLVKKLYIIPRYMSLSDSSVALRGTTDLFDITDEADAIVTHGSVKIKSVDSPAIFAFGENGWAIESKGRISALGKNH